MDTLLRLRGVHRLRNRARGGLAAAPGGREPGHGSGPQRRERGPGCVVAGGRPMMRLRARFQKLGKVRWTSHRDVARMWERACRRVQLPLAWTGGFSPRPKLSFGLALPTGAESLAEYLDLELVPDAEVNAEGLPALLGPALPVGVDVTAVAAVDPRAPSLQEDVESCTWRLGFAPSTDLPTAVDRALASSSLLV